MQECMQPMQEAKPHTGLHELSLLAQLIKPDATKASNFKLNLFGDAALPIASSPGQSLLSQALYEVLHWPHAVIVLTCQYCFLCWSALLASSVTLASPCLHEFPRSLEVPCLALELCTSVHYCS